jgi:hypothetical protein
LTGQQDLITQVVRSRNEKQCKNTLPKFQSGSLQKWDMAEEFVQGLKLGFSLSKGLALVKVSKQHSIFYLIPKDQ